MSLKLRGCCGNPIDLLLQESAASFQFRRRMKVRHVYHEEDLLQPLDAVFVPRRADVNAARLTADQMLRQQHDEPLREQKQDLKSQTHLLGRTWLQFCVFKSHSSKTNTDHFQLNFWPVRTPPPLYFSFISNHCYRTPDLNPGT